MFFQDNMPFKLHQFSQARYPLVHHCALLSKASLAFKARDINIKSLIFGKRK